ncbi:hypothetical protein PT974_09456 [Cladobotryum mycophilum]|uniref:Leucine rich repeat domain protein n=1 Tax=Cladobotryum mycophilum TaxID=491253 RepID=A0ABR0SG86_9HYPO
MSEEPTLPRLPAVSWDEKSQSFSNNPRKRVRNQRRGNAPPLSVDSSDPAIFSSDDDPGLDNYVEGRRKKRYVGSWFQQHPTSSDSTFAEAPSQALPKPKRTLRRQFDSGVYLGSDATDCDEGIEPPEVPVNSKLPQLGKRAAPKISQAELVAQRKIQDCLDQGAESVDLWSLGLEEISNDTVSRLAQLTCIPIVTKDVAFEQRDPELRLFLAKNSLRRLPGALFDLTHLTVLTLRGNQLTELPPAICKLSNLKQLNLSQNRLHSLPAEFLDAFGPGRKMRELVLHPNPFLQPETQFGYTKHVPLVFLDLSQTGGRVLSHFRLPSNESPEAVALEVFTDDDDDAELSFLSQSTPNVRKDDLRPSLVPSLVETALRACYRTSHLHDLESYIPDGLSHLQELVRRAVRQHDIGGLTCSRCRKMVVVPAMEWIEWRELGETHMLENPGGWSFTVGNMSTDKAEMAVPFLHRACSWQCGPKERAEEPGWSVPSGYTSVIKLPNLRRS